MIKSIKAHYDSNTSNSEMNAQMMMIIPNKPSMQSIIIGDDSLLGHRTVYGAILETLLLIKAYAQSQGRYKLE